ncbi:hypothetical protein P43SY_006511 [Pythium insidiosum]|uniref:Uncharacterized protein n=1 Tax=Pythium insidiosum TaxID=114742 RepID=A0AAD5Q9J3_PYTIN|nr:hypothetical protein P43SY_006511 [Pythium insidiosum]
MPRSEADEDPYDSVDEDAELELSCALHDLAERVKSFEARMEGRLKPNDHGDDDEEIGEDIPEADDDADHEHSSYGYASPKKRATTRRTTCKRSNGARQCQAKSQQSDEDDDDYGVDDDHDPHEGSESDEDDGSKPDWNEVQETEQLSEIKHNIALLLQGIKAEAKALEASVEFTR